MFDKTNKPTASLATFTKQQEMASQQVRSQVGFLANTALDRAHRARLKEVGNRLSEENVRTFEKVAVAKIQFHGEHMLNELVIGRQLDQGAQLHVINVQAGMCDRVLSKGLMAEVKANTKVRTAHRQECAEDHTAGNVSDAELGGLLGLADELYEDDCVRAKERMKQGKGHVDSMRQMACGVVGSFSGSRKD